MGGAATLAAAIAGCGEDEGEVRTVRPSGPAPHPGFEKRPGRPIEASSRIPDLGPLLPPDENGLRLPAGFRSRLLAQSGQRAGGNLWHPNPDGGAVFPTAEGGWIYVSNSEVPRAGRGGAGAIRFDARGNLQRTYRILSGTTMNCAGGATPWQTWLSCEETSTGRVHECDPWGEREALVRPALGTFAHEAVAYDLERHQLYLTEDSPDGCLYRFTPESHDDEGYAKLDAGTLEVACVDANGRVTWSRVPDPEFRGETPTRAQVESAAHFRGGEGIYYANSTIFFTTKYDGRVWKYDIEGAQLSVLYSSEAHEDPPLFGVDNVCLSASGDVLVAEDGGAMRIVAILPSGDFRNLVQIVGQPRSEMTGPAFDPSGTRLYFSSQRGTDGAGLTYEIEGPFHG